MPQPNWDDLDFWWRDGGFGRSGRGGEPPGPHQSVDPLDADALRAELAQLRRARWGGANTITYQANGVTRTVTYKTDRELAAALTDLERRLAEAEGLAPPRSFRVFSTKGW